MPTQVLVPPLGQTVDTVTLVSWYKQEGDEVRQGEPLFVVETDKAALDVEAPATGTLRKISARPGDEVKALSTIALILAAGEALDVERSVRPPAPPDIRAEAGPNPLPGHGRPASEPNRRVFISPRARRLAEAQAVPLAELVASGPEGAIVERDVRSYLARHAAPAITPVARRVAQEAGVEWRGLAGSGPRGQITRQDVEGAIPGPDRQAAPEPTAQANATVPYAALPASGLRSVIAGRMLESSTTTAPVTLTTEADATQLVKLREKLRSDGLAVTYNDLLIYVLAHALREHPRLNASLDGDTIKLWSEVHVGLAVDTDRGLLVPVVRNAERKGLAELAGETHVLVDQARAGRCAPDQLSGSTFTLTNLGPLGIDAFTPIINLPECAILGVGRIKSRPVVAGKKVRKRYTMWLSLTFDHRIVDGAPAARFLQRVVQLVEAPHLLLA
jgi:pyruvate dehydrogenase E2 component (dihydrolipoamide acetyltransferase)